MQSYYVLHNQVCTLTQAAPAYINKFPWHCQYQPFSFAQMVWDKQGIHVHMQTDERPANMALSGLNVPVYTENCMELFLMPDPGNSAAYINWEWNPAGALYLSIGTCREDRKLLEIEEHIAYFQARPQIHAWGWEIGFRIPREFVLQYFPSFILAPAQRMRGNFYKIADQTQTPHYGCWADIEWRHPDFHRPEFFGDIILQ